MEVVLVFGAYGGLVWTAASKRVWWALPAVPVLLVGFAAVIGVVTYEAPPAEDDVIMSGLGEFLLAVFAIWLASAVCVGWAVRLWRAGRRVPAIPFAVAGVAPWAWMIVNS